MVGTTARAESARLAELTAGWLAAQQSANTRAAYGSDFGRFVDWCARRELAPLQATAADIAEYARIEASAGVGDATAARRLSAVSSFFRFAVALGALPANPAQDVARPGVAAASSTPALDTAEGARLLDAAARVGSRAETLVAMLLLEGLKLNEVLAIDLNDLDIVDFAGASPSAVLRLDRRGQSARLDLDERTAAIVAAHRGQRRHGPLLLTASPTHQGTRLSRFGADYLLKQAAAEAGLAKTVSANVLRRTFVTHAVEAGRSLASIQAHIGHDDQRTTRRLTRSHGDT